MASFASSLLFSVLIYMNFVPQNGFGCVMDPGVPNIADFLSIKYTVIANYYTVQNGNYQFLWQLNFTNTGSQPITIGNWRIYFSHTRMIYPQTIRPNGTMLGTDSGLNVYFYNGVLFWIEPNSQFKGFGSGQTLSAEMLASDWEIARTDIMPNWYVVSKGDDCNDTRLILSTVAESLDFVTPFTTEKQWKRISTDKFNPYSPDDRYMIDQVTDDSSLARKVIPTPMSEQYGSTMVDLSQFVVVIPDDSTIMNEANLVAAELGLNLVPSSVARTRNFFSLMIGSVSGGSNKPDSYQLLITPTQITITGYDPAGVYYGIQTLLSLVSNTNDNTVPAATITDSPRFEHRGVHVDVSRNFHTVDDLKRLMNSMALYKLNRLHIHLGNDEGWRLEIPGLPELTQIGGNRCHDLSGNMCIMPQLGSSPTEPNHGSGFYTVEDYQSILTHAMQRHIVVMPEFDMPGHAHAAIHSMLARYRKYNSTNTSMAEEYLLTDLNDMSDYFSVQGFTDNAINPCVNSTYTFIEKVIGELKMMHEGIQPLKLYHIGGDEVASGAWIGSPLCQAQFGTVNVTQTQVKGYFLSRINDIVSRLNVTPIAWEDGLTLGGKIVDRTEIFSNEAWVNSWDNVWGWGTEGRAYNFSNAGYKVVLNHATHLFFDFPAEPDPEERGYYWATRVISLKKAFSYMPDNIYDNMDMDVDRMGNPVNRAAICAPAGACPALESEKASNIMGMQAQLWCETIRTSDELEYMAFPRLLALAERVWHKADWESITDLNQRKTKLNEDWAVFANTLGYKELRRLDELGIKYRIPLVGAKVDNSSLTLQLTCGLPGLEIQYRESTTNSTWMKVEGNALTAKSGSTYEFRTRAAESERYSRTVIVTVPTVSVTESTVSVTESTANVTESTVSVTVSTTKAASRATSRSSPEQLLLLCCLTIILGVRMKMRP